MRRVVAVTFGGVAQPVAATAAPIRVAAMAAQPEIVATAAAVMSGMIGATRRATKSLCHDAGMAESDQIHRFDASARWTGDGAGSGEIRVSEGRVAVPIAGATSLGGSGGKANPEELLLAAVGACFANTWAIFLKKLQVPYETPELSVTGELGPDPAGGFQMQKAVVRVRVPAALLAADRAKVEKTLALAEKYCIISKVARAAMPLSVEIVES